MLSIHHRLDCIDDGVQQSLVEFPRSIQSCLLNLSPTTNQDECGMAAPPASTRHKASQAEALIIEAFYEDCVVLMTSYFFKVWTIPLDNHHMEPMDPMEIDELFSTRQRF
jgi:hypothetical protein